MCTQVIIQVDAILNYIKAMAVFLGTTVLAQYIDLNGITNKTTHGGLFISSLRVPKCDFHMGCKQGLDECEHDM